MGTGRKRNQYLDELLRRRPARTEAKANSRAIDEVMSGHEEPHRHRILALKAFCEETGLALSELDLSGFSPEPYRSLWKAGVLGRDLLEAVGGDAGDFGFSPGDFDIPEEEAVRAHLRDYWYREERQMDVPDTVRRGLDEQRFDIDQLAELVKILEGFRNDKRDPDLWQLMHHSRLLKEHVRTESVSTHITSLQDLVVPVLVRIHEEKRKRLNTMRDKLKSVSQDNPSDARLELVRNLLTVRKERYARPVAEDDLWTRRLFGGQRIPCLFGPRLAMVCGRRLLDAVLVLRAGRKLRYAAFLNFEDIALVLMALGVDEGKADETLSNHREETPREYFDRLQEVVKEDWGRIEGTLPAEPPLFNQQ